VEKLWISAAGWWKKQAGLCITALIIVQNRALAVENRGQDLVPENRQGAVCI